MWATFVIFYKLLKENNHQMGENVPNLVTLEVSFLNRFQNLRPVSKMNFKVKSLKGVFY
jgi:hypothetical protein